MTDVEIAAMLAEIKRLHPGIQLPELSPGELRTVLVTARHDAEKGRRLVRVVVEPFHDPYFEWVERSLRFEREEDGRV